MRRIAPVLLFVSFLVACQDTEPTGPSEPGPVSLAISDGAHDPGNPEFFFFPPLVPHPMHDPDFRDSPFNPDLEPFVRICELNESNEECVRDLAPDLPMRLRPFLQRYSVWWKTRQFDLDNSKNYRIKVMIGTETLGFRDVDPGPRGSILCRDQEFCKIRNGQWVRIQVRIEQNAACPDGTCDTKTFDLTEGETFQVGDNYLDIPAQSGGGTVTMSYRECTAAEEEEFDETLDLPTFGPCMATDVLTEEFDGELDEGATATISFCDTDDTYGLPFSQPDHLRVHSLHEDGRIESLREAFICPPTGLGSLPKNPALRLASKIGDRILSWIGPRPLMATAAVVQEPARRPRGGDSEGTVRSIFKLALDAKIDYVDPDDAERTAEAGSTLPTAAIVRDIDGNPVAGARVRWNVIEGAGSVSDAATETDADGIAEVDWTLDSQPGENQVTAGGRGIADSRDGFNGPRDDTYPLGPFDPFTPIAYDEKVGDGIESPEQELAELIPEGTRLLFTATGTVEEEGVLYGVNSNDDGLSIIDVATGDVTFIGELDPNPDIYVTPVAMAVGPNDELYVWNNSDTDLGTGVLLTADACTGVGTPVNPSAPPQGSLGALAYSPTGTLYGLGGSSLYTIDTSTGEKSLVGSLGMSINIAAADFDPGGTLYGVELFGAPDATPERLVTINTSTGQATEVGTLDQDIGAIGSIVFDASGRLIGSGFSGPSGSIIYDIDKTTGAVTNIRTLSGGTAPQGMGFAPICEGPLGYWEATGSMNVARRNHAAALLTTGPNAGKVLIVGGVGGSGADLYDPVSGTFTPLTTQFSHGEFPTATAVNDTTVLIVGGTGARTSAEIYNPVTNSFIALSASTNADRVAHTATLLDDGRVLLAAGQDPGAETHALAELYDPSTGTFVPTGSLNDHRNNHSATLLPDGTVLIVGGTQATGGSAIALASAEIYDPATGSFSFTGSMAEARTGLWWTQAPLLSTGKVLVVGWSTANAELFDPATGTFSATGSMATPHSGGTVTLLSDGRVLVAGGSTAGGPVTTDGAELYDPATGVFLPAASMIQARQQHTATLLLDGRVLATGGTFSGYLSSAELYTLP